MVKYGVDMAGNFNMVLLTQILYVLELAGVCGMLIGESW